MTTNQQSSSISHIEDLSVDEFLNLLRNISTQHATEKMDGSNLWIGVDENNTLFTSREGKRSGSSRCYSLDDWPDVAAFNQFKAAHAALELKSADITKIMPPGSMVEAEVLFGRQPNSVIYGSGNKSYIAFLRGVNGTSDAVVDNLNSQLQNQEVEVTVELLDTSDGETLDKTRESFRVQFTTPQKIDSASLQGADVTEQLTALEAFLRAESAVAGLNNKELMLTSLTQVKKDARPEVKAAREAVLAQVQREFKIPIKQVLLDKIVKKLKSALSDEPDAGIGIEGIVLRDPTTGRQVKIVDRDTFSIINRFNQAVRGEIQGALNTTDPDSPLESRGGLVGTLRIRIADVLGNRELARPGAVKKILEPIKGETPEQAIRNFADTMAGINDYTAIKKKVLAMTAGTATELKEKLEDFKENQSGYSLKLKNGTELKLSPEVIKRTLLSFAEAKKNLTVLFDKVKVTTSLAQLLAILYGVQAKKVHQQVPVEERLLENRGHGEIDRVEYNKKDQYMLLNSYLATVLMTMLIHHEHDTIGARRLRDRKNYMIKRWHSDMSPLNFWGYVIWRNEKPDIKKQLATRTQQALELATKKIMPVAWKMLHMQFSYNKELKIRWVEHQKMLHRLIDVAGLRSERLNTMLDNMIEWPALTSDEKNKTINRLYLYAQQFVPRSSLFARLRVIQTNLLLNATGTNTQMVESLLKAVTSIPEEEGDGGPPSGVSVSTPASTHTGASSIAALPTRIGDSKTIIKRKRNPGAKLTTLKFPDPRKAAK